MRRLFAIVLPVLFAVGGGTMSAAPASAQTDVNALRQGLIYQGLQRAAQNVCGGNYQLSAQFQGIAACTHGPDPAPPGVDVRAACQAPAPGSATAGTSGATGATQVPCVGNGSDGDRVQLIYARAADRPDQYANWLPSMQQWAAQVDDVFNASAAETGGIRHVRYVEDSNCVPIIDHVVLSTTGDDNFNNTLNELRNDGYTRTDRKYLVWVDANVYCGIAQIYYDDSPGSTNASDGSPSVPGEVGRVDSSCWGQSNLVEAHELVHLLGGVQTSAPNATPGNHCTDDYDRLCYNDGTGTVTIVCPDPAHENRLDCNHDDYYSTAPPSGSYLATHWNVADSAFLTDTVNAPPTTTTTTSPPTTTTTTRPTTTTTRPSTTTTTVPGTTTTRPSTTTTSTTTTVPATTTTVPATTTTRPSTTTTTVPPTTTTTGPPGSYTASAPQSLFSTQPSGTGKGTLLFWSAPSSPGSPPFTTYRIYRGTSATNFTRLTDVGSSVKTYNDATAAAGTIYWYEVTAVNAAGESPPSNVTRMVGK